jgi:hypothetical protein
MNILLRDYLSLSRAEIKHFPDERGDLLSGRGFMAKPLIPADIAVSFEVRLLKPC